MPLIDESQAKGLVNRIFRNLYNAYSGETLLHSGMSHRKTCKKIKGICDKKSSAVFIAERYEQTNNWQLIWGEWSLFNSNASFLPGADKLENYDKIAFDLTIHRRGAMAYKFYYIVLTKHALVRLLMRCNESIKNPYNLNVYLKKLTKKLFFASLVLAEKMAKTGKGSEGYTIIDGYYLPLVITHELNKQRKTAVSCNIKTFMPDTYDSAVNKLKITPPLKPSDNFFDYERLFIILDEQPKRKINKYNSN